jgi:hypothetical protein
MQDTSTWRTHIAVIAWVNIILGAFGAIFGGLVALGFLGGAVALASILPFLAPFVAIVGGFIFLVSASGVILGWGLLGYENWARILGIVLSIFHLAQVQTLGFHFLFGVYSLIILFHPEVARLFGGRGRRGY